MNKMYETCTTYMACTVFISASSSINIKYSPNNHRYRNFITFFSFGSFIRSMIVRMKKMILKVNKVETKVCSCIPVEIHFGKIQHELAIKVIVSQLIQTFRER